MTDSERATKIAKDLLRDDHEDQEIVKLMRIPASIAASIGIQFERERAQILVDALQKSRRQFDLYRQNHLAKGTDDGAEKAATNHACMIMCDDALAQWEHGQ